MIKIRSMRVALNLFCFGHFFPIPKISAPAKVIVAAIHSARATAAKLEIMDGFAFDDVPAFFAPDCVPDNSRHDDFLFMVFCFRFRSSMLQKFSYGQHVLSAIPLKDTFGKLHHTKIPIVLLTTPLLVL